MDPVSLTGLGLRTLQLAVQSGCDLHQFVLQTRNVDVTVEELASEIKSLQSACRIVHEQLRVLGGEYDLQQDGFSKDRPISTSIQKELKSCQRTLRTLRGFLVDVRDKRSNSAKQGWRQFKLNLKQDDIHAMKSRIHSHTSALQVCLMVMDINVSHLAPKKVGNELKTKLDGLGLEIQRLQGLLRAHCEKVDLSMQTESAATSASASALDCVPESTSIDSVGSGHMEDSLQDRGHTSAPEAPAILACAQDTLSRATSLYEESLYEPSISSTALSSATRSSRKCGRMPSDRTGQARPLHLSEAGNAGEDAWYDMPVNLPVTLQQGFRKLHEHLHEPHSDRGAQSYSPVARSRDLPIVEKQKVASEGTSLNGYTGERLSHVLPLTSQSLAHSTSVQFAKTHSIPLKEHYQDNSPSCLNCVKHIEEEVRSLDPESTAETRGDILSRILAQGTEPLCKSRIALIGKLGIGKSYVAAAMVQLTLHRSPKTPIFWIRAAELAHDCQEITDQLGLRPPPDGTPPWVWVCKVLRRLSTSIIGPWLVVIDGVGAGSVREHEIEGIAEIETGSFGCVLMTTRVRAYAEKFAKDGVVVDVTGLDPVPVADMLGQGSNSPISASYDGVAYLLNFDPYAIVSVRTFLEQTGMDIDAFADELNILTDEASWHAQGVATAAARLVARAPIPSTATSSGRALDTSSLLPVIRCCLHPLWPLIFEELHRHFPAACELLGALAAMGWSDLSGDFLLANDARDLAAKTLVDQCLLSQPSTCFQADRMMLLAHRVWLLSRNTLSSSYGKALRMVAVDYPESSGGTEWMQCRSFEPLAIAITSTTANSWMDESNTTRWFKSMLLQKRSKFFRDSGTNKWEGDELEAAEVTELQIIHGMKDPDTWR